MREARPAPAAPLLALGRVVLPDGVTGVAVPFYLAHPRLARLERAQMLEVEGGTPAWCLRILRHEVGHASRTPTASAAGSGASSSSARAPRSTGGLRPAALQPSFVVHLEAGYAQSHPDEDFAETFAVWLTPGSTGAPLRRVEGAAKSSSTWTRS